MKIFLHIGLHKTGTTFFQQNVFPLFDPGEITYNPPRLMDAIGKIFTAHVEGAELVEQVARAKAVLRELAESGTRKLLVSEEDFSQRFASFNFAENLALVKSIFPDAVIILFLRFQPDWVVSAYKQRVKHYPDLDILRFMRQVPGPISPKQEKISIDPLAIDFAPLLRMYMLEYGRENVKTFFYEDFEADNRGVTDRLAAELGQVNRTRRYRKVYKGNAALFILFRIAFCKLLNRIGSENAYSRKDDKERHLPSLSRARKELSMLAFLVVVARKAIGKATKEFRTSSLLDWDMLRRNGMRAKLEAHYRKMNLEMVQHLKDTRIPPRYLP